MSAETRSYAEALKSATINTAGYAGGCVMVAGAGTLTACATIPASALAGITVGASCAAINYLADYAPEDQIKSSDIAFNTVKSIGTNGFKAFNYARPMLFSTGYKACAKSIEIAMDLTALAANGLYTGAKNAAKLANYVYENSDKIAGKNTLSKILNRI